MSPRLAHHQTRGELQLYSSHITYSPLRRRRPRDLTTNVTIFPTCAEQFSLPPEFQAMIVATADSRVLPARGLPAALGTIESRRGCLTTKYDPLVVVAELP